MALSQLSLRDLEDVRKLLQVSQLALELPTGLEQEEKPTDGKDPAADRARQSPLELLQGCPPGPSKGSQKPTGSSMLGSVLPLEVTI